MLDVILYKNTEITFKNTEIFEQTEFSFCKLEAMLILLSPSNSRHIHIHVHSS